VEHPNVELPAVRYKALIGTTDFKPDIGFAPKGVAAVPVAQNDRFDRLGATALMIQGE
jgi:hypothetical protein